MPTRVSSPPCWDQAQVNFCVEPRLAQTHLGRAIPSMCPGTYACRWAFRPNCHLLTIIIDGIMSEYLSIMIIIDAFMGQFLIYYIQNF